MNHHCPRPLPLMSSRPRFLLALEQEIPAFPVPIRTKLHRACVPKRMTISLDKNQAVQEIILKEPHPLFHRICLHLQPSSTQERRSRGNAGVANTHSSAPASASLWMKFRQKKIYMLASCGCLSALSVNNSEIFSRASAFRT